MNRRDLLGMLSGPVVVGVSGCLTYGVPEDDDEPDPPRLPDGMEIETREYRGESLLRGGLEPTDEYHTTLHAVISSEDDASQLVDSGISDGFIEETSFEDAYVVVVQRVAYGGSEFVVDAIDRTERTLHVFLEYWNPNESDPADSTPLAGQRVDTFAIRITDTYDLPERVLVTVPRVLTDRELTPE